jgi:hypothetical protein
MITRQENFLTKENCDGLIGFHRKFFEEFGKYHNETKVINLSSIKSKFPFIGAIEYRLNEHIQKIDKDTKVSFFEVVEWRKGLSMPKHKDFLVNNYTSIINLNDDYEGGQTIVDEEIITPKMGQIITFEGSQIPHGVLDVKLKSRFTLPVWYVLK